MLQKPIIGITMGDPAGIGPEITVSALLRPELRETCRPLVFGDAAVLRSAARLLGREGTIVPVSSVEEARFLPGTVEVLHLPLIDMSQFQRGAVDAACGNAAFQCVRQVIASAMKGEVDATVTNPLNKEALNLAGHAFSGHTEIYASLTGTEHYTMMLACDTLRVLHVSTHVSLAEACRRVKKERVLEVIRTGQEACRMLGIAKPRLAVAGLNPHGGENGLFGREEIEEISPAIAQAKCEGIVCEGPLPPDTVFAKARGGMYDIVVAMYHDQGHIPLKMEGFVYRNGRWQSVAGVNITLGLPIIRTSVDHGTAFDLAGKGLASDLSLLNAIDYATRLAVQRRKL